MRGKTNTRKKVAKSKRVGPKVALIKQIVKTEQARQTENKTFQYLGTALNLLPSNSPGFDANIIPCTPYPGYLAINQGTGQGGRIGNKIQIKKLKIDGVLFPAEYNATTNPTPCPIHIKVWFFYDKEDAQAIPTPVASGDFFQFGSTAITFQNEFFDHTFPVNQDRYRVLTTKTFKVGYASYTGTGGQPLQGNFSNNDYKLNARLNVDLTKHCVKSCTFRDNSSNPTTRAIFMMMQPVYANGNPMTAAVIPGRLEYMLSIEYEDA